MIKYVNSFKILLILSSAVIFSTSAIASESHSMEMLGNKTINICEDRTEWPPYIFYKRINGKPTSDVTGYSVDVIKEIFKKRKIRFKLNLLPWTRCQAWVKQGMKYQLALNASYSEERARKYHLSRSYHNATQNYFYSKKHHPKGLDIRSKADLKKHRVCGILGYDYENIGLKKGEVDQNAEDLSGLIIQLHANRCTLFTNYYEILAGFAMTGKNYLADKNLGCEPIPGVAPTQFHMLISKNFPYAEVLKHIIDEGIADMEASGMLREIMKKYNIQ